MTTPQPVLLTTYQGAESWPSFSPDGNQIAFAWNGEGEDNFDIYVKLVGPGTPLRLTTDPAPDIRARWSPDGQKIALMRQLDSDTVAVLLVSPLGGPETRLGQFHTRRAVIGLLASLCWSADSRHLLAAASQARNQPNAILRLSIDTREVKTLATITGAAEGYTSPDLSPAGRTLAAVRVAGARTRIPRVFERGATQPRGMHRRSNAG